MVTRVVIDTNVLVAAFGWDGKPRVVFRRVLEGEFELIVSRKQLVEIRRVISYPRLKFTREEQASMMDILMKVSRIVDTKNELRVIAEDPADNVILEAAIENGAAYVISGDRHVLDVGTIQGVQIVNPEDFLAKMDGEKC